MDAMPFAVQYLYLEPESSVLDAETAQAAATSFFAAKGGPDGNWGRTVLVRDVDSGEETRWAFIRQDQELQRINEYGDPLLVTIEPAK